MRKIYFLIAVLLLAACSDSSISSKWVAETIPTGEQKETPVMDGQVNVYTPTANTTGVVIKQQDRDKWLLVDARHVANHPYALIHEDTLTLGETVAIDVTHQLAVMHFRNSYHYEIQPLTDLVAMNNEGQFTATAEQVTALLNEAVEQKMTWQQRLEKNEQLIQHNAQQPIDNYTTYYSKNIFTYNVDELKQAATVFVELLNDYVHEKDDEALREFVQSDDVAEELYYVASEIEEFEINEAYKRGVYYFVNGQDKHKKEVRLTFIRDQQHYQVIGANFLSDEHLAEQKIPHIQVTEHTTLESVPAVYMFVKHHIPSVHLEVGGLLWELDHGERKIEVTNGAAKFSCDAIELTGPNLILTGCSNTKKDNYIIATFF